MTGIKTPKGKPADHPRRDLTEICRQAQEAMRRQAQLPPGELVAIKEAAWKST